VAPIKPDLRSAIEAQFSAWSLTPAEQEISMLILKGLSNKEIAAVRSASEMTIKQQANAIYRKSGIANRSQLLAFFLEDLF
jgi:DNA-binding CsgD family transcriptional regulator